MLAKDAIFMILAKDAALENWNDIRIYLALVRSGSVRNAAVSLGIGHATVARRIIEFEKRVGVRLFEHSTEKYAVTPAGKDMLVVAEKIETELFGLERRIVGKDKQLSGYIRVTMIDVLASHFLMPHLTKFSQLYPDINLEVSIAYQALDMEKREADVALRFTDKPPEHLIGKRLVTMHSAVYASIDYLTQHDINSNSSASWIGFSQHGNYPAWVRESDYPQIPAKTILPSLLLQLEATKSGMGISMLPCFIGDPEPNLQRLPSIKEKPQYGLWLLMHTDVRTTTRLRVFTKFIADAILSHRNLFEGSSYQAEPMG